MILVGEKIGQVPPGDADRFHTARVGRIMERLKRENLSEKAWHWFAYVGFGLFTLLRTMCYGG